MYKIYDKTTKSALGLAFVWDFFIKEEEGEKKRNRLTFHAKHSQKPSGFK